MAAVVTSTPLILYCPLPPTPFHAVPPLSRRTRQVSRDLASVIFLVGRMGPALSARLNHQLEAGLEMCGVLFSVAEVR